MRTMHKRLLSLLAALGLVAGFATTAMAADHRDAPNLNPDNGGDPAADINDVYVFRATDTAETATVGTPGARTVFVMTVFPFADATSTFSDAVDYEFVVADLEGNNDDLIITCTSTAGVMTCLGTGHSTFTAAETPPGAIEDGIRTTDGNAILWSGLREDPFFFDLADFLAVYNSVLAGSPDPAPLLDDMGVDTFAGQDTLAIVVDVDNSVLPGTQLAVYGRTVRQGN